ncbi:tlde1 domain-containing protein [Taylorella equigenitalis]|uniref:tlde1 domain-containing protein n=1 Tax=Taylorella equigenitalis TaxID=29575 RepID=UPI00237C888F|nr:tlde1 domain-containing protein [Taylorella equigenitalis]WDU54581.1 DUF2778 domain-containing protein [Taylorella equigenitalis]
MWFALLRIDEKLDDQTIYNSQVRSLFRLYPRVGAGESWGCITLLNLSDFYVLHKGLLKKGSFRIPGTFFTYAYGQIIVRSDDIGKTCY